MPPGSLTLAWDPSIDSSVVGYRLYHGTVSQVYTTVIDIGNQTTSTILGLVPGVTYYFAVTAYDSTGLESAFSGEISYTVPVSAPRPTVLVTRAAIAPGSGSSVTLSGTGPIGSSYQILATQDFISWTILTSVTLDASGSFQFTDAASPLLPRRFYRLLQTPQDTSPGTTSPTPATAGARIKSL